MPQVSVIDTRVANIASMCVALERLEAHVELASTAEKIAEAEFVVLPGVGSFAAGMERITALQIGDAIRNRVKENQPTLAVCLGLQLFCASSAESPNTEGLGIVNTEVERFDSTLKVPQLGWNTVSPKTDSNAFFESGAAYFANSFCVRNIPEGWEYATTNYGGDFVSSFWKGRILCCQFHPELSGTWGLDLMKRWLSTTSNRSLEDVKC